MHGGRFVALGAAAVIIGAAATPASADDASQLFDQGIKLYKGGETRTACEKFEASYALDPAPGTLSNMAACHEKLGKLGLAELEYWELSHRADNAGKRDAAATADGKAGAIAARMANDPQYGGLRLAVSPPASVRVDGFFVPDKAWSGTIALDVGGHLVEGTSNGGAAWTRRVTLAAGSTVTVQAEGTPERSSQAPTPAPSASGSPGSGVSPGSPGSGVSPGSPGSGVSPGSAENGVPRAETSSRRGVGEVIVVVGGIAVAAGAALAVLAAVNKSADSDCSAALSCPPAAFDKLQTGRTEANIATIALAGGGAALGLGFFLMATPRRGATRGAAARPTLAVAPRVGTASQGFELRGAF